MSKEIQKNELRLTKTYDNCVSRNPKLTVVMIHGIASNSGTFNKTLEDFSENKSLKDVRFVTFDLLGSGKSFASDDLEYNFSEQLAALDNSINELALDGPVVLIGHSMGCLVSINYASRHKKKVRELILVSPPIYRPDDFNNPIFEAGMKAFEKTVIERHPEMKGSKAFYGSLKNIVMNHDNYAVYAKLDKPTSLIFGLADQIIASFNIPRLTRENKNISAIETPSAHNITKDKSEKVAKILERILGETV